MDILILKFLITYLIVFSVRVGLLRHFALQTATSQTCRLKAGGGETCVLAGHRVPLCRLFPLSVGCVILKQCVHHPHWFLGPCFLGVYMFWLVEKNFLNILYIYYFTERETDSEGGADWEGEGERISSRLCTEHRA